MPDPPDPICNLACQTKIILNGGNIAAVSNSTHQALLAFFNAGGKLPTGEKLIKLMNKIENDVVEAQKLAAELMGYTGEVGKMLE